jgi:formyl-CoA transferase
VGVSIGDTLASLHGVIGILMALHHRHASVSAQAPKGRGQVIDVALYEAVFNCMESLLPEYSAFGTVREAAGSALPGIAPSNAYPCTDGWVLVAGNGDSIFSRLMRTIGRADWADDPSLVGNAARVKRIDEIDAAIGAWTQTRSVAEVLAALHAAQVPGGRLYTARDIAEDPHYRARGMVEQVTSADGLTVEVPGIVPKLSATPGRITRRAPTLGEDTSAVLREIGITPEQEARLRERGVL